MIRGVNLNDASLFPRTDGCASAHRLRLPPGGLNTRTRYRIITSDHAAYGADATLHGTILKQTVSPLTYDPSSGQTSSYLVSVTASVEVDAHDGTVLYRNDAFAWREQYQSTQDLSGFVQEDGAAVRRMGRDFAQAVVSDMLESFK
jgi:hypothetical protein